MDFRFLPFLDCLKGYRRQSLKSDALAGLTVALVLIPQSMAYAQLDGFCIMILARKLNSRVPGVLAAVVVTTLMSWALGSEHNLTVDLYRLRVGSAPLNPKQIVFIGGGEVIGAVPRGLPSIGLPRFDWAVTVHLLPFAAIVALLGFMEEAIRAVHRQTHKGEEETSCQLKTVVYRTAVSSPSGSVPAASQ